MSHSLAGRIKVFFSGVIDRESPRSDFVFACGLRVVFHLYMPPKGGICFCFCVVFSLCCFWPLRYFFAVVALFFIAAEKQDYRRRQDVEHRLRLACRLHRRLAVARCQNAVSFDADISRRDELVKLHRVMLRRELFLCARLEKVREDDRRHMLHIALALNALDDLFGALGLVYRQDRQIEIDLLDIHQVLFHDFAQDPADVPRDRRERSVLLSYRCIELIDDVIVAAHVGDHVREDLVQVFIEPVNAALTKARLRDDVRYRDHLDGLPEAHLIARIDYHPALVIYIFLRNFRHVSAPFQKNESSFILILAGAVVKGRGCWGRGLGGWEKYGNR